MGGRRTIKIGKSVHCIYREKKLRGSRRSAGRGGGEGEDGGFGGGGEEESLEKGKDQNDRGK